VSKVKNRINLLYNLSSMLPSSESHPHNFYLLICTLLIILKNFNG